MDLARQFKAFEKSQGRTATPKSNLAHALEAEARAQTIIDEHWDAVSRVAELALQGLPMEREALLRELHDVPQDEPNCGEAKARAVPLPRRKHSLLTNRGVQERGRPT